jgi:hypothetical protein
MRQVKGLSPALCIWIVGIACQQRTPVVSDLRMRAFDPVRATAEADIIVLAEPLKKHDLRLVVASFDGRPDVRVVEVEVLLKVHRILKGAIPPQEIRYRFYDARGYAHFGPPSGPSGPIGSKGIFFLRRDGEQIRAFVDVYRPDISTPWTKAAALAGPCVSAPNCIAQTLLGYDNSADPAEFSAALIENVAISRQLVGFLGTFALLGDLVKSDQPQRVRTAACDELQKWYVLEFPKTCRVPSDSANRISERVARLREELLSGRTQWIARRVGNGSQEAAQDYLRSLTDSHDQDTRLIARRMLKKLP